jgi:hypothetical protein
VPEWGPLGSVRGALSNERPYRDLPNVVAKYPFGRSHRFPVIEPNSGRRDYSRSSCDAQEERVVTRGVEIENKHVRLMPGAISLSISIHFPIRRKSMKVKPVILPRGATGRPRLPR